jgi:hypothetical protein
MYSTFCYLALFESNYVASTIDHNKTYKKIPCDSFCLTMAKDKDTNEDIPIGNLGIPTADEILFKGLNLLGWDTSRVEKWKSETALEQYRGMHGVNPVVTAQLCEDLQRTEVEDARIEPRKMDITKLHWTLHFLYRYPSELERTNVWNKCANTVRDSCWFFTGKI